MTSQVMALLAMNIVNFELLLHDGSESRRLGPEDVSLERRPHFRGCYVQNSMELELEDVPY